MHGIICGNACVKERFKRNDDLNSLKTQWQQTAGKEKRKVDWTQLEGERRVLSFVFFLLLIKIKRWRKIKVKNAVRGKVRRNGRVRNNGKRKCTKVINKVRLCVGQAE